MAENNQNQFRCSGDCLTCRAINDRRVQWQYCAAQFSYNALRTMQAMQETISVMSGEIKELNDKIEAIQNSEATVFDPNKETSSDLSASDDTAQQGDGAGIIDAPKQTTI